MALILEHPHLLARGQLITQRMDPVLLQMLSAEEWVGARALPWKRDAEGLVLATCTPCPTRAKELSARLGAPVRFVQTSARDLRYSFSHFLGRMLEKRSTYALWRRMPHLSAKETLSLRGRWVCGALFAVLTTLLIVYPQQWIAAFAITCQMIYAFAIGLKLIAFIIGWRAPKPTPERVLSDEELPVYTIFIPLFREPEVVPGLIAALEALDYPQEKLDVMWLLESDDTATWQAVTAHRPPPHYAMIRLPPGKLRTKPKACNYGLRFARGDIATIFDADDRPAHDQLRKAAHSFAALPEEVVCLQARLCYYNAEDRLLTRWFALEYAMLFRYLLVGLERLGIPVPLGGTSNHFRMNALRELGGWDPFNVTEDADLGIRLHALGYRTQMLDSDTYEEAPNRVHPWLKQRTRWIKGYMQTWLVHMRDPVRLWKSVGWRGFIGFQCFVGFSVVAFLTAPFAWAVALHTHVPTWVYAFSLFNLAAHLITNWFFSVISGLTALKPTNDRVIAACFYPFYFVLHSVASMLALWQLIHKPHYWAKTAHGRARTIEIPTQAAAKATRWHRREIAREKRLTAPPNMRYQAASNR